LILVPTKLSWGAVFGLNRLAALKLLLARLDLSFEALNLLPMGDHPLRALVGGGTLPDAYGAGLGWLGSP